MSKQLLSLGKTKSESIRNFLGMFNLISPNFLETWEELAQNQSLIYANPDYSFKWCHLYELPTHDHLKTSFSLFIEDDGFKEIIHTLVNATDQIGAIPEIAEKVDRFVSGLDNPTKEEAIAIMPFVGAYYGVAISIYNSMQCLLYFGCYLNELIDRVRAGDDEALFNAIRVDPTAIGCTPVINRITKATFTKDEKFFKKLKAAINGKPKSRDQKNYQKMRMVLEILHEANAPKLKDDELEYLFVDCLNLYYWDEKEGGNAKALRKFVDTYMKKTSTT